MVINHLLTGMILQAVAPKQTCEPNNKNQNDTHTHSDNDICFFLKTEGARKTGGWMVFFPHVTDTKSAQPLAFGTEQFCLKDPPQKPFGLKPDAYFCLAHRHR